MDARDVVISVRELHIRYLVFTQARPGLRAIVSNGFRGRRATTIHAVRGITLDVRRGEVVGIIGQNGSGKSTLLRAIVGGLPASEGEVLTTSQPMLLGVASALRPSLTGRVNVTLGLLALGLPRSQVDDLVHDVIEFADIGEAIDHPMSAYSSGMRARLHFAIATSIEPDILLVDEALAVGDKDFRARSYDRIERLRDRAGAVLVVSHSIPEIKRVANRVIWIEQGVVRDDGDPDTVIEAYEAS